MRLLLLGGTRFTGRWLTQAAVARGHHVTVFHRGSTEPGLLRERGVEHVLGDRQVDLSPLRGHVADAVIDFCGYFPRTVAASAELLQDTAWYGFVSSVSAYAPPLVAGVGEGAPLHPPQWPAPDAEVVSGGTYGPMKVACEQEVVRRFGSRSALVRPGFMVGPWDPSDRFPALLRRAVRGRVLVPGAPSDPLQFVDTRDLADFLLQLAERAQGGVFDAVHPRGTTTLGEVLQLAAAAQGAGPVTPVGADLSWLQEQLGDRADTAFPLWDPDVGALHEVAGAAAKAAGLRSRPVADTVRDTVDWDRLHPDRRKDGLSEADERSLVAKLLP